MSATKVYTVHEYDGGILGKPLTAHASLGGAVKHTLGKVGIDGKQTRLDSTSLYKTAKSWAISVDSEWKYLIIEFNLVSGDKKNDI